MLSDCLNVGFFWFFCFFSCLILTKSYTGKDTYKINIKAVTFLNTLYVKYCHILLKKCEELLHCNSSSHFVGKIYWHTLAYFKRFNESMTNGFFKLTMLWTSGLKITTTAHSYI